MLILNICVSAIEVIVDTVRAIMNEVTRLLSSGDPNAAEKLLPLIYDELRRVAADKMANLPSGQTLQPTALVHEAYIRLIGSDKQNWKNRSHFFSALAEAMRWILVGQARRKKRAKHGGGQPRIPLADIDIAVELKDDKVLLVDEALEQLEREDTLKANIVKLHYYVGLTHQEIADALGVSEKTIRRHWSVARVWLFQRIKDFR